MFCPNCGTKNDDGVVFCGNCGNSLLEQNPPVVEPVASVNSVPSTSKKRWIKLVEVLAPIIATLVVLGIGVGGFVSIGKSSSDYKKTAEKYVESLISGDYEDAFNSLTLPSSEFLTADTFKAANADIGVGKISTMTITDSTSPYATPDSKVVNASYVLNIGEVGNIELTLDKASEKHMLFFDKYKINATNFYEEDIIVIAPKSMTVKVNGVVVDSKYILDEKKAKAFYKYPDRVNVYEVPYIFLGNVKFSLESDITEVFEYDMVLEKLEEGAPVVTMNFISYTQQLKFKSNLSDDLAKKATEDIQAIIKAAVDGKAFFSIDDMVSKDASWSADVKQNYEFHNLNKMHPASGTYDFTAMNITNIEAVPSVGSYITTTNGQLRIKVEMEYECAGAYTKHDSLWGDTDYIQETTINESGYFYYTYENGKWVIANMYLPFNTQIGTLVE